MRRGAGVKEKGEKTEEKNGKGTKEKTTTTKSKSTNKGGKMGLGEGSGWGVAGV